MFSSLQGPDRRKEEQRIRNEGRLPPGQSLTFKFPVLHYGPVPPFNPATWDFRVWGEVEQEKTWTWSEFNELPRTKVEMDIHCVTRWSKFDTVWEGVSVKTMVDNELINIKSGVTHVMQHAEYGFTVNLPLEVVLQDNFLLATHFNGEPITPDHGYPLRGVVGFIPGN
ncbi:MAG: molybdopterin-dependent oxidoreductase, partial [Anaerolineales bacterium]|nr:molybdopterin-dependent oxidoreductase [Anaerolineales bacterium]